MCMPPTRTNIYFSPKKAFYKRAEKRSLTRFHLNNSLCNIPDIFFKILLKKLNIFLPVSCHVHAANAHKYLFFTEKGVLQKGRKKELDKISPQQQLMQHT